MCRICRVAGQVVSFMTRHLGYPIPSPAIMEKIGTRFRRAVGTFAEAIHIPVVRFAKDDRKMDVMHRYVQAQAGQAGRGLRRLGPRRSTRMCSPRPNGPSPMASRALASIKPTDG